VTRVFGLKRRRNLMDKIHWTLLETYDDAGFVLQGGPRYKRLRELRDHGLITTSNERWEPKGAYCPEWREEWGVLHVTDIDWTGLPGGAAAVTIYDEDRSTLRPPPLCVDEDELE
jgi:hypothetical protein